MPGSPVSPTAAPVARPIADIASTRRSRLARCGRVARSIASSTVARGALTTFAVRIFGAATAYATQLYLARRLGAEQLGVFAFAWTWLTVLAFLTPIGFDFSVVRFVPSFLVQNAWERIRGILAYGQRSTLAVSTCVAAVWIGGVLVFAGESTYRWAMLTAPLALPIVALVNLHAGIARGFHRVAQVAVPSFGVRPALLLAGSVVAVEVAGYRAGLAIIVVAIAANLVTLIIQKIAFRRTLPAAVSTARPVFERGTWLRVSLPMMAIASFELILANTDILMIGVLQGPGPTGVYNVAVRTASCLLFVFFAVNAFAAPRISELHAQGDRTALLAFCRRVRLGMLVPTLFGAVMLWLCAPWLLACFGKDFSGAELPMVILSSAAVLRAAAGPMDSLLSMTGHQTALAYALGSAVVTNLVLNWILIPIHGSTGAAVATTLSVCVEIFTLSVLVGRRSGFWPFAPWRASS